ncbi:uncharacterized protein mfsd8l1 isoform X2 [Leucoraja erinacea]|uniref:uncharacterized protein mfsd8l1 isoform X2 n=1 Tax=Leucoraja erinaceus TaxID=7782 RepID=UPI0024583E6E|nr:uncharacterized protein mfsd8l1 isoform X2 [Leucoraja erinacea]
METRTKRRLTNGAIGLLFLFSGIEYAVILPTIWAYLETLKAEPYFLGLGLSAFSFSGLIAGPILGHISDRSWRTKPIILFANLFEIVGNFMYFMGYSKWLLLGSRLVAGIGTGAGACIFGYLTRSTSTGERATVFAVVMAARQAGLLIGPGFNLFLRLCNFNLGPFKVNKYTSPGLFMCLMWTILQVIIIFMYYDLPLVPVDNCKVVSVEEEEEEPLIGGVGDSSRCSTAIEHDKSHVPPTSETVGENSAADEDHYIPNGHIEDSKTNNNPFHNFSAAKDNGYPNDPEIFQLWRTGEQFDVLYVWSGGGFSIVLCEFVVGVFLQILGLPFVAVSQVSLFSKVTAEKTQGFSQGLRRSIGGVATIMGPMWAGGLINNLYIMFGVMMGLLTLLTIMMILSYSYLVEPAPSQMSPVNRRNMDDD